MNAPRNTSVPRLKSELLSELSHLRHSFRDSLNAYGLRVEGQLVQVIHEVQGQPKKNAVSGKTVRKLNRSELMAARKFAEILSTLKGLEIKPEKGRRRDLRKVEKVALRLVERL